MLAHFIRARMYAHMRTQSLPRLCMHAAAVQLFLACMTEGPRARLGAHMQVCQKRWVPRRLRTLLQPAAQRVGLELPREHNKVPPH